MKKLLARSLLISLAVWTVFSWPLAMNVGSAIPAGVTSGLDRVAVQPMEPGDHLQLLYHFWLFSDMVGGHTPWFHNRYEFNTGDDAARLEPGSYYFPFSLFYTVGQAIGGPAFGWNLSGFLALWLTYLGTLLLVRRYTEDALAVATCALLAIVLPYRWMNIAAGSPTGFAMMWVPWLLLGLDLALRESKARGGWLAGFAVLLASWGDPQVFFFSGLMIPCWCLFALAGREAWPGQDSKKWLRLALAAAPIALGAVAAVVCSKLLTQGMSAARLADGRTWKEVALFSPHAEGLGTWRALGITNHIYLGFSLGALLLLALVLLLRREGTRPRLLLALLLAGAAGIVLLALGPYGPMGGRCFAIARKVIPHYVMIRQPAKIFCLLPSLLAVAAALLVTLSPRRVIRWSVIGLLLAAIVEFHVRVKPVLCRLDTAQGAYAAAAAAAPARPAALVLPLWPGDSHYTSVYQYYALQSRLRLVNGYRAFAPAFFQEDVFHRFESANQGLLDDAQADALLAMHVPVLLFHEDYIPEKVSPFAGAATLKRLLNHPRLTVLKQDGPVWAFRIEAEARARPAVATNWATPFPARHFDSAHLRPRGNQLVTHPFVTISAPDQRWLIRARGQGELTAQSVVNDVPNPAQIFAVQGTNWQWLTAPQPAFPGLQSNYLAITRAGAVQVDYALFAAGPWSAPAVGESLTLPAPSFFHAGHTDMKDDSVVFRAGRDRKGLVLYGPKLPLEPGRYTVEVAFTSPAAAGTKLGLWLVTCPEGRELKQLEVRAGAPLRSAFDLDSNLPLLMIFQFHGTGDLRLHKVTITRDG